MSRIHGIETYTNSMYLYNQMSGSLLNSSNQTTTNSNTLSQSASTVDLLSTRMSQTSSLSLTDQLTSLVRLTRYAMDAMGLADDSRVTFSRLQQYREQVQENFTSSVQKGLEEARVDFAATTFTMDSKGTLSAHSANPLMEAMAQLAIDGDAEHVAALRKDFEKAGVDLTQGVSFALNGSGGINVLGEGASTVQAILDAQNVAAVNLAAVINAQHLDPKLDFSLKINEDDTVTVNSADPKYTRSLQAFFDVRPDIVKEYLRAEALSGVDDARKFLKLSPSDMKTRLQLESMALWWDTSGKTQTSTFGAYNNGVLSRLNGVNVSV